MDDSYDRLEYLFWNVPVPWYLVGPPWYPWWDYRGISGGDHRGISGGDHRGISGGTTVVSLVGPPWYLWRDHHGISGGTTVVSLVGPSWYLWWDYHSIWRCSYEKLT